MAQLEVVFWVQHTQTRKEVRSDRIEAICMMRELHSLFTEENSEVAVW